MLIVPVMSPDRPTGILVGKGLEVAGGLGRSLDRADWTFSSCVVEVTVDAKESLRVVFKDPIRMFAQKVSLMTAHEVLVAFWHLAFGLQVYAKKAKLPHTHLHRGIENAALHGEFLRMIVRVDRLVGQGATSPC